MPCDLPSVVSFCLEGRTPIFSVGGSMTSPARVGARRVTVKDDTGICANQSVSTEPRPFGGLHAPTNTNYTSKQNAYTAFRVYGY